MSNKNIKDKLWKAMKTTKFINLWYIFHSTKITIYRISSVYIYIYI